MVDLSIFSRVDYWSLAAVPVKADREDHPLGHGSAFFHMWHDQTYLVTAWHVLSGRHFQTGQSLCPTGAWPTHLTIWWNPDGRPGAAKEAQRIPLHSEDGEPRWVEIKRGSEWIDVAILPVDVPAGMQAYPVNELPEGPINQGMGGDLFIIGFPMRDQPLQLPIWKRASLASEPEIPEALQPYQLVDTASRKGMSGAPVVQRVYRPEATGPDLLNALRNPGHRGVTAFDGVYSGRFKGPTEEDMQLGIMWPGWWIPTLIEKHIGRDAYETGLQVENDRRVRVTAAFADAMKNSGRWRTSG